MSRCTVLLLGDSISLGYREHVKKQLSNCCKVIYPKEQGKSIADIYRMIFDWNINIVKNNKIDLVYWNAGLWDVVHLYGEPAQTPLNIYLQYVKAMNNRLRTLFPNAKICFANITCVVENRYNTAFYRLNSEIKKYNADCYNALINEVDAFDDLYSFTEKAIEKDYVDATHYNYLFNRKMGKHISELIENLLEEKIRGYRPVLNKAKATTETWIERLMNNDVQSVYVWGVNENAETYSHLFSTYVNIVNYIDIDRRVQGISFQGKKVIAPEQISLEEVTAVISMLNTDDSNVEVQDFCIENNLCFISYKNLLEITWPMYEGSRLEKEGVLFADYPPDEENEMVRYIGINVKENNCNLDCNYCYLSNDPFRRIRNANLKNPHNPKYIRCCLSRKKLGGSCLIGITGTGETMLADKLTDICVELLKEGHYLHIVTNGTCIKHVIELVNKAGKYAKHIIFKLSFHYQQLKENNMLDVFKNCVDFIDNSEASYTIELMPHDEIVDDILEIQDYSLNNFGALPHLTIGRDDRSGARLLTSMSAEQYFDVWGLFDSSLFDLKKKYYLVNEKNCQAGNLSCYIDLLSGKISRCYFNDNVGNLYLDNLDSFKFESVRNSCPIKYCYNCHIFAPLNILRNFPCPTYTDVRDRVKTDGTHWIKPDMRRFLSIKLN